MKIPLKRAAWWAIYAVWIALVVVLVSGVINGPRGGLKAPDELLSGVNLAADTSWMGIYLHGQKIGYVRSELFPLPEGGYEIREFSRMSGGMLGTDQTMLLRMEVQTDSTLALVSFAGGVESRPYNTEFSGKIVDDVLQVRLNVAGRITERFIAAPEPLYVSQAIKPLLQAGRLGGGDSLRLAGFDPVTLQMDDLTVRGGNLEEQLIAGKPQRARKLTTSLAGFESVVYVDAEGNSLFESGPMGLTMRREPMEQALEVDQNVGRVDFHAIYAVKPTGSIGDPRLVTSARYRIGGGELKNIAAASDRQNFDAASGILTVGTEAAPSTEQDLLPFLAEAPFIESDAPDIRRAAALAAKGGVSRLDSAGRISDWVFRSVAKRPAAGIPSALAVLKELSGDCNEHSVLFTALARSLGIPARIQLGVVYQEGRFFYHAWPAVWDNGRWVEFDPTFGQRRADAARISLAAGDMGNALELVGLIGNLTIEIVEAK